LFRPGFALMVKRPDKSRGGGKCEMGDGSTFGHPVRTSASAGPTHMNPIR